MYSDNKQLKNRTVIEITKETRKNLSKLKNTDMGSYDKVIDYLIKQELNNNAFKKLEQK